MKIENNNYIVFGAKFFHTESLQSVAKYAAESGRFEKLNQARKNINNAYLDRRLTFELFETEGEKPLPYVVIKRYTPKKHVIIPKSMNDYKVSKPFVFTTEKKVNPLIFGYKIIRKLGYCAPNNDTYKEVVAGIIKK